MTKLEFMKELESLLLDIPLDEREEALQYYNGYFEDAGVDHEDEIVKELGSPKRVASIIKADLNSNIDDRESRGYFTEKGYQDTIYKEDKYEIVGTDKKTSESREGTDNRNTANNAGNANNGFHTGQGANFNQGAGQNNYQGQAANQAAQDRSRNTNIGLVVLICILGSPILVSIFGVLVGVVSAIVGIIIGFGAAGLAMIGSGIALFVFGLVQLGTPYIGLALCGSGLLVLGIGMLFALACWAICAKALPAVIKGIVNLCKAPFKDRRVVA